MTIPLRQRTLLGSGGCGAIALICYLATLTRVHTFDALSYILDVNRKPWQELFHPHHLAYGPLGALVSGVAAGAGWEYGAGMPMQFTNAVAGALGVALFCAIIYQRLGRTDLACCGALLLGGSYAYWYYAIEVEVYTIGAVFLLLCLWLMIQLLQESRQLNAPATAVWLGLAQGMAVLFHQTNVLLSFPIALALLLRTHMMHPQDGVWSRTMLAQLSVLWGWYAATLAIVVGGAYGIVIVGVSDLHSWQEVLLWLTAYAHTGWWGGPITDDTWSDLGKGLAETLVQTGGGMTGLFLVGIVVASAHKIVRGYGALALCLSLWLVAYGGFFLWWEPDNIEFWIASLPPALMLLVLALARSGPVWHAGVWMAVGIGVGHAALNAEAISARGRGDMTPQWHVAYRLAEQTSQSDLILVADGLQELYLQYDADRPFARSLNHILHEEGGEWENACTWLHREIDVAMERGDAVWIGDAVLHPEQAVAQFVDPLRDRFQVSQTQIDKCFALYRADMHPMTLGEGLPVYYRLASAQERAIGVGWDFTHRQGWRAANIRDERFEMGWEFVPEIDPYLLSPPFAIEAADYCAMEVRMATTTDSRELELFVVDERGMTSAERSMRWRLEAHDDMVSYQLPLRGETGWSGTVHGLRIDPVSVGDGGRVRIELVRLRWECLGE